MKKILAYLSILLMGIMIANQAIYFHSHVLIDGQIISHAHPFNKTEKSKENPTGHTHTNIEILVLAQLTIFFLLTITAFLVLLKVVQFLNRIEKTNFYAFKELWLSPLRAPPLNL